MALYGLPARVEDTGTIETQTMPQVWGNDAYRKGLNKLDYGKE